MATETILHAFNLLCVMLITFETTTVQSQQCHMIQHTTAVPEDLLENTVLKCDKDFYHEFRIFKAEYRVMRRETWRPTNDPSRNAPMSCFIRGLSKEVEEKCHRQRDCYFQSSDFKEYNELSDPTYPYACDSFKGVRYVMVTWQCRAQLNKDDSAYAIDLNDARTHDITFAVVDTHDLWRWVLEPCHPLLNPSCTIDEEDIKDAVLITEHDKGCSFVIPANTEVWVDAWEFYKFPPRDQPNYEIDECSQKVQVYNDQERWVLCQQRDFFSIPCQDTEHTLYLKFESDDTNVRVGFAVYVEVDYMVTPMMASRCGIPVSDMPPLPNVEPSSAKTTTTTTTNAPLRTTVTTTMATTTPKDDPFDFFDDMPIWLLVLIAIIVAIIIMLIVIAIVCFRHCCGAAAAKDRDDEEKSESDYGSEVTKVYVDGDHSSKLVAHSLQAYSRSHGELPLTH